MSRFLGPIHHWLFNKIKLYEKLESAIIDNVQKDLNTDLSDIMESLYNKIGYPIENKPLEELIDTNNIHGWLQSKITKAETRQAALITNLIDKFGEDVLNIVKNTYKFQAINCGKDVKNNTDISTAPNIYKALNNYILDGMPCDNVNNITINEENKLQWKVLNCLHKGYWLNVNGNLDVLYDLRSIWISNFIENANPAYSYSFEIQDTDGQQVLVHQISK